MDDNYFEVSIDDANTDRIVELFNTDPDDTKKINELLHSANDYEEVHDKTEEE